DVFVVRTDLKSGGKILRHGTDVLLVDVRSKMPALNRQGEHSVEHFLRIDLQESVLGLAITQSNEPGRRYVARPVQLVLGTGGTDPDVRISCDDNRRNHRPIQVTSSITRVHPVHMIANPDHRPNGEYITNLRNPPVVGRAPLSGARQDLTLENELRRFKHWLV